MHGFPGELKPKTVKSPGYLLSEIADLDRERIHFPLHDTVDVRQEDFITQDEIDYALCIGSGFADGKFRIYEYFMDLHNQKENADFLKKNMGLVANPVRYLAIVVPTVNMMRKVFSWRKEAF